MTTPQEIIPQDEILDILSGIYPFRKLGPEHLTLILENSQSAQFQLGQMVYAQNDPADYFYLVLSGRIGITITDEDEQVVVGQYLSGTFFGYEMLYDGVDRQTGAVAQEDSILLCFNRDQVTELVNNISGFVDALELLAESNDLAGRVNFSWLGQDEMIYYIARRHIFVLIIRLLMPGALALFGLPVLVYLSASTGFTYLAPLILVGALLLIIFAWAAWIIIDWNNDYAVVTNQRMLFIERVVLLYESRQEAPLNAILSITTESDQIGRILNYGNVVIRTYAGMIVLPALKDPGQVAQIVEAEWFRARLVRSQKEKIQIAKTIEDKVINRKHELPAPRQEKRTQAPPVSKRLSEFLATMFRMQYEAAGNITYRKHWFILFLHIWAPTLVMIGLLVFLIGTIIGAITILSPVSAIAAFLALGAIVAAWWWYQYMDWHNDFYLVTDEQVLDVYKKPLGREERRAAPLRNIQSIEFERRGLLGLILNYGTVFVLVGETTLTFDDVFNPSGVQRELFKRIAERDYRDKQQAIVGEQQRMTDWLEIYDRLRDQQRRRENPPQSG